MSLRVTKKLRFDDSDVAPDGYWYAGFNFLIADDHREYCVRLYDDEPGSATVIEPDDIARLPEARELMDFHQDRVGMLLLPSIVIMLATTERFGVTEFRAEESQEAESG
ncbi:MAG: hypothetical protein R3F19_16125 [Verrucomicrobiales bacterium]